MKIKEDKKRNTVAIDGFKIGGFSDSSKCSCGTYRIYYEEYDAFFCPQCNKWLEKRCNDPKCEFCSKRFKRPLPKRGKRAKY